MRLFSELKRRNVLRMTVLYVVATWLIMQVAGVLIDLTALPAWTGPWVLAVLAIGFPIALVISWFYEITPEGIALENDVAAGESITRSTGRRMDVIVIAMLCSAVILFAWDKWWPDGPMEQSIAVLPFENMSNDPDQEFFSDGISEEILNLLAQIRPLKVIARTSSFSFKGKNVDISTMAEQLGVRHILEGSVRRDGEQVRITAQLIDARDSSHLWSEVYDRDLTAASMFHIQTEIARAIAGRLKIALTEGEDQRLAKVSTENMDAYAAYLLGRQRLTDRKVLELAEAAEQFALAIELDPDFAAAYSGLADACYLYDIYSGGREHASCPGYDPDQLLPLVRRALALDDDIGEAWVSLGNLLDEKVMEKSYPDRSKRDWQEAHAAFDRGLALNPTLSQGYLWYHLSLMRAAYANLHTNKEYVEVEKLGTWRTVLDRGLEIDPLSVILHYNASYYPNRAQTIEDAWWHARRIIEIAPESPKGYERLGEISWDCRAGSTRQSSGKARRPKWTRSMLTFTW